MSPVSGSNGPPSRTVAESSRVEAFSDGVLAIAITLLVLNLHSSTQSGKVAHDILAQWPVYVAYIATFLFIGVVWVNHHAMFTRIAWVDGGLLWRNLALLLPASVLPFPTAELAFAMNQGTHTTRSAPCCSMPLSVPRWDVPGWWSSTIWRATLNSGSLRSQPDSSVRSTIGQCRGLWSLLSRS